jgi:AcrR family transcriptional regulator
MHWHRIDRSEGGQRRVVKAKTKVSLTRSEIIETALELVAEVGVDKLSMRQLSERLGASLGATYRHVSTKDELLSLCARALYERSYRPRLESDDPMEWVRVQLVSLLATLFAHPGMASYVINQPDLVPTEMIDTVQTALLDAGFTQEDADAARLVLYFYLAGVMLSDTSAVFAAAGATARADRLVSAGLDYILLARRPAQRRPGRPARRSH